MRSYHLKRIVKRALRGLQSEDALKERFYLQEILFRLEGMSQEVLA